MLDVSSIVLICLEEASNGPPLHDDSSALFAFSHVLGNKAVIQVEDRRGWVEPQPPPLLLPLPRLANSRSLFGKSPIEAAKKGAAAKCIEDRGLLL